MWHVCGKFSSCINENSLACVRLRYLRIKVRARVRDMVNVKVRIRGNVKVRTRVTVIRQDQGQCNVSGSGSM